MNIQKWSYTSASAVGTSHSDKGEAKQDNVAVLENNDGHVSFCVSDGAGSSKHSEQGSKQTVKFVCDRLIGLPALIEKQGIGPWINDHIIQIIIDLRADLYAKFGTYDLREYHCTLVSGVIFDKTTITAHIGDGFILAGKSNGSTILNDQLYFSEPENGEYKNETYFLTESIWLKHLNINVFTDIDWVIAGSDGGADVLSEGERLQDQLTSQLLNELRDYPNNKESSDALDEYLNSDQANTKTYDDKSLIILRSKNLTNLDELVWDESAKKIRDFYPKPIKKIELKEKPKPPLPSQSNIVPSSIIKNRAIRSSKKINRILQKYAALLFTILFISVSIGIIGLFVKSDLIPYPSFLFDVGTQEDAILPNEEADKTEEELIQKENFINENNDKKVKQDIIIEGVEPSTEVEANTEIKPGQKKEEDKVSEPQNPTTETEAGAENDLGKPTVDTSE